MNPRDRGNDPAMDRRDERPLSGRGLGTAGLGGFQAQAVPWRPAVYDPAPDPVSAPRPRPRSTTAPDPAAPTGAVGGEDDDDDDEEEVLTLIVDQEFMDQLRIRFGGDEFTSEASTIVRVPVSFARQIHFFALRTQLQEREEEYEAERRRLEEDEAVARLLYQEMVETQRRANVGAMLGAGGDREGLPPAEPAAQAEPERRQGQDQGEVPRPERRDALDYLAKLRLEDRFPNVEREMVHFLFNSLGSEEATAAALEEQLAHNWAGPLPSHPAGSSTPSAPVAGASGFLENEARGEVFTPASSSIGGRRGVAEALEGHLEQVRGLIRVDDEARTAPDTTAAAAAAGMSSASAQALEDMDRLVGDGTDDENPWDSTDPMMLHTKFRAKAEALRRQRDDYNSKAKAAFQRQNRTGAGLYAQKGALFDRQYQYYSAMATAALLAAHSDRLYASSLDLHSFKVAEAVIVLDLFLDHYIRRLADGQSSDDRLSVITGKGMHSPGGRPRVKPAVLERVAQRRLRFEEFRGNPGAIRIFITGNSLLAHQVPGGPSSSR